MPVSHSVTRGQTSLEYLLLLAVVAVVVIASFRPGSLISQVHDSAQGYYNSVTRVIMGENPRAIDGGWCPVTCPSSGSAGPSVIYPSCECPAPAFGGKYCSGSGSVDCSAQGVTACGTCPTGQVCNSSGQCGCPNSLICGQGNGPTGSIPSADCAQCICPAGTTFNQSNNSCSQNCSQACTAWNGTACVAVVCGQNMFCDASKPASQECACNAGTIFNAAQGGCAPCPSCTTPSVDGKSCVSNANTACQSLPGTFCNPSLTPDLECACDAGLTWNGDGCS
jgi:Flp pilus assembly pilin Flp